MKYLIIFSCLLPFALSYFPFYTMFSSNPIANPQAINPLQFHLESRPQIPGNQVSDGFGDGFQPRFSKLFRNPFGGYNKPRVDPYKRTSKKELCDVFGGSLIGEECLEYFKERKTYLDAREACRSRQGDLYEPLEDEGFLFQKFALYFPQAFHLEDEYDPRSLGWIGAKREGPGQPILTVSNRDVTKSPVYNMKPISSGCVHIFPMSMRLEGADCKEEKASVCEYPLDPLDSAVYLSKPNKYDGYRPIYNKYLNDVYG